MKSPRPYLPAIFFLVAVSSCTPSRVIAQAGAGAVAVRIPVDDGKSMHCVNASKERIWLTLRRLITNKYDGLFTTDKSVAIFAKATLTASSSDKPIAFPLMTEARLEGYGKGQVSVPVEYTLVNDFSLAPKAELIITNLAVDLTLVNTRKRTSWGNGLKILADVAKGLPIPKNAIVESATYVLDFANRSIQADLDATAADDKAKSATLALNFSRTGSCGSEGTSDFERTGTLAILQDATERAPGYIAIADVDKYCWSAELRPVLRNLQSKQKAGTRP